MASRKSRLPPSKHRYQTANEPPESLTSTQFIGRITKIHGNAIYTVELPSKSELVVELPTKFLNAIWVRRGGYVLMETDGYTEGKVSGGIIEVITDDKAWKKKSYWYSLLLPPLTSRPDIFAVKESDEEVPTQQSNSNDTQEIQD